MKKSVETIIKESLFELKKLRTKQTTLSNQKRINCLIHLKTKRFSTRQKLANHLGIHVRTQERWLLKYINGGLESLIADRPSSRVSKIITPEIHEALEFKLSNSSSPLLGYWDAQQWVEDKFEVKIKYHWLRKYLITHFGTKLKSPRKSHYKKDEQAIEAFLKTAGNTK